MYQSDMRSTLIPWATGDQIAKLQALVYDIKVPGGEKKKQSLMSTKIIDTSLYL